MILGHTQSPLPLSDCEQPLGRAPPPPKNLSNGKIVMCDGHPWCTTKTTNILNDFGLSFRRLTCAGQYIQCPNIYCDYMHHNGSLRNNIGRVGSTPLSYVVGDVFPIRSTIECKVYRSIHVCIVLCHARIIYNLFTSLGMSRACTHLGVHDHHLANDTCCEALNIAYQCIANEVLETPTSKNSAIVMATEK